MKQSQPERALPADVFDAFEYASLECRGVGAGADYDFDSDLWADTVPCCIHGIATEAEAGAFLGEMRAALYAAKIDRKTNDEAVRAINKRKGANPHARVDFLTEFVPELNIVRE